MISAKGISSAAGSGSGAGFASGTDAQSRITYRPNSSFSTRHVLSR